MNPDWLFLMAVAPPDYWSPGTGEHRDSPESGGGDKTGTGGGDKTGTGGVGGTAGSPATRQSGGSVDVVGSIPGLNVPQGSGVLIRVGKYLFRFIQDRFEGVDRKRSPTEIGELQFVTEKNALTDEQTIRKRPGSADVSSSGAVACIGLHEVAGLRELTLDAMDAVTGWTESDVTNFTRTLEATIKAEGTGSLKLATTGALADGDTIKKDLGAGGVQNLSTFDYIELLIRGLKATGNSVFFGVSEDDTTYTEVEFAGTTTETWITLRLDLSGLSAAQRDAIRYLRLRAVNGSTAQIWYVDIIRAVRRFQHRLLMKRTAGSSTGGVRDYPQNVTVVFQSDESGAWADKGDMFPVLASAKMRAVDYLGVTYIAMGAGGMLKYEKGILGPWNEAPPSLFLALHNEKLWALSQTFEPHGLRHTTVGSATAWLTDTDPTGGDGGLMYVGRRYRYLPTGMRPAFTSLWLWTEGDLWALYGANNATYDLQRLYPGAGTLSHESIALTSDMMIWHDGLRDRILMSKTGGPPMDVGVPIQPDLKAIPTARKPWTGGACDGRFYYFSYTRVGQTLNDRTWVLDTDLLRWHGPFEGDWCGFTSGLVGVDGLVYLGLESGVRKIPFGATDNGAAIALGVKSAALSFRFPRWRKRMRRAVIKCQDTAATLTLNFYRDLAATPIRSYQLAFTGLPMEAKSVQLHEDVAGDVVQWEITESSVNPVVINEVGFEGALVRQLR